MKRSHPLVRWLAQAYLVSGLGWSVALASGPIMPEPLLGDGGHSITGPPEFFYSTELRLLAAAYRDQHPELQPTVRDGNAESALAEDQDFAAALAEQRLKPPDPALATRQHAAVRAFINATPDFSAPLPPEFDSEFRDYHVGALAFRRGQLEVARAAFDKILARPVAERHYRSTWALYMLARMAVGANDSGRAVEYCQQVRRAVADGFADSTHCASASLRLEARFNEELATELMLQDLARRNRSGPFYPLVGSLLKDMPKEEMERRARSRVLREVTSCQLMGGASGGWGDNVGAACQRWLAAVESAGVTRTRDADRLGWIAYCGGDYTAAGRWLKLTEKPTALSLWLKAKLELRAGHQEAALAAMKASLAALPEQEYHNTDYTGSEPFTSTGRAALGDAGLLQLACGNFRAAMVTFLQAKLWLDAAWVAERLMTTAELKAFIDLEQPWDAAREAGAMKLEAQQERYGDRMFLYSICWDAMFTVSDDFLTYRLRWLLARRLAREGRLDEAMKYYPPWLKNDATTYQQALHHAADVKRAKADRARDWWTAAWLARTLGLELMGTEREPDNAAFAGQYEAPATRKMRLTGKVETTTYDQVNDRVNTRTEPIILPVTRAERTRLKSLPQPHTRRWHYRITAADHAWHAARLMPNGTEELADVLNCGGGWLSSLMDGEDLSQKFYDAIEARCPATDLGRKVLAKKNFITDLGPLSGPPMAKLEAERKAAEAAREAAWKTPEPVPEQPADDPKE